MNNHGTSFYKMYIFRFTDFNGILNKNAKQSIVNFKRLYICKICNKRVLEHISIFTGKHLCWVLLLIKLQTFFRPATLLKRKSNANVFQEYCKIFRNIYFEEHLQTTASEKTKSQQIKAWVCKKSPKI